MSSKTDIINFVIGEKHKAYCGYIIPRVITIVSVIDEGLTYCPVIVFRYYHKKWVYKTESAYLLTCDISRANNKGK